MCKTDHEYGMNEALGLMELYMFACTPQYNIAPRVRIFHILVYLIGEGFCLGKLMNLI